MDIDESDKSDMDLYAPNTNLDIHQCPRCKWSFSHRIPRTLDCNHSFYFCEHCLRRKEKVQCGLCGHVTKTTQILSPARASREDHNIAHSFSMFSFQNKENNSSQNNDAQFAGLPTQIEYSSSHTLRGSSGSPAPRHKHRNASSDPVKHQNTTPNGRFKFVECDQILKLENEIERLKSQLRQDLKSGRDTPSSHSHSSSNHQDADVEHMKQQMLQLMLENERLNKQCASLTHQTELQQRQINGLHDKLLPLKLECTNLRTQLMKHKQEIFHQTLTPFKNYVQQVMQGLLHQHTEAVTEYNREVQLRRKYFNLIQNYKGNIRIYCRIRPLLPDEIERSYTAKVQSLSKQKLVVELTNDKTEKTDKKTFEFDRVFSSIATQDDVFDEVNELIISVMDGYNVCLFAYGQTGSGKTYTMEGVNQRAIKRLFTIMHQRRMSYEYQISVSMVEIYNEKIKDLLCVQRPNHDEKDLGKKDKPVYLNLRGNDKTGMYIADLSEMKCTSNDDVCRALNRGYDNRSVGVTDMNEQSSRSHCVLALNVRALHKKSGGRYASKLNLIDLAGSERVKQSNASGERLKEAQNINRSLSCLGNVLMAIKDKKSYVPYRDSVLTLILKDSIGNNAKTAMFCNVSSCSKDLDQTSISLAFASKLKNVCMVKARIKPRRQTAPIDCG